jgi:hypothetical protein
MDYFVHVLVNASLEQISRIQLIGFIEITGSPATIRVSAVREKHTEYLFEMGAV